MVRDAAERERSNADEDVLEKMARTMALHLESAGEHVPMLVPRVGLANVLCVVEQRLAALRERKPREGSRKGWETLAHTVIEGGTVRVEPVAEPQPEPEPDGWMLEYRGNLVLGFWWSDRAAVERMIAGEDGYRVVSFRIGTLPQDPEPTP